MIERDHSDGRAKGEMREVSLGAMLRRARESRNLSIEDLARSLRLDARIIRHLEGNRFDQLPAAAFTRGYLRSIAKKLDIAGEPLIATFDEDHANDAPMLTDFESRAPLQITSDSRIIRYTTLALVAVMVVLVALWWRSHRDTFSMLQYLTDTVDTSVPVVPATDPLPYTWEIITHPDAPTYRAPDPPASAAEEETSPPAAAIAADIVISVSADAWIQITDVKGQRLYYDVVTPGNEIRVTGQRPYSLVIGNAPAVTLSFEGKPVNLIASASEGVARLQLGQVAQEVPAQ